MILVFFSKIKKIMNNNYFNQRKGAWSSRSSIDIKPARTKFNCASKRIRKKKREQKGLKRSGEKISAIKHGNSLK